MDGAKTIIFFFSLSRPLFSCARRNSFRFGWFCFPMVFNGVMKDIPISVPCHPHAVHLTSLQPELPTHHPVQSCGVLQPSFFHARYLTDLIAHRTRLRVYLSDIRRIGRPRVRLWIRSSLFGMCLFSGFRFYLFIIFSIVGKSKPAALCNSEVLFFPAGIHFTVNNRHLSRSPFFVQVDHQILFHPQFYLACSTIDSPLVQRTFR